MSLDLQVGTSRVKGSICRLPYPVLGRRGRGGCEQTDRFHFLPCLGGKLLSGSLYKAATKTGQVWVGTWVVCVVLQAQRGLADLVCRADNPALRFLQPLAMTLAA